MKLVAEEASIYGSAKRQAVALDARGLERPATAAERIGDAGATFRGIAAANQ